MPDEVDVRGLAVVYGVEVIVAVDRVESAVVGKLLFCDRRVVLQAQHGVDVVLPLGSGQLSPAHVVLANRLSSHKSIRR